MSLTKTDLANDVWDAALITGGAFIVSMASKRLFKDSLGVTSTAQGALKLVAAISAGSIVIQYLQKNKYIPDDPFTKKAS